MVVPLMLEDPSAVDDDVATDAEVAVPSDTSLDEVTGFAAPAAVFPAAADVDVVVSASEGEGGIVVESPNRTPPPSRRLSCRSECSTLVVEVAVEPLPTTVIAAAGAALLLFPPPTAEGVPLRALLVVVVVVVAVAVVALFEVTPFAGGAVNSGDDGKLLRPPKSSPFRSSSPVVAPGTIPRPITLLRGLRILRRWCCFGELEPPTAPDPPPWWCCCCW